MQLGAFMLGGLSVPDLLTMPLIEKYWDFTQQWPV